MVSVLPTTATAGETVILGVAESAAAGLQIIRKQKRAETATMEIPTLLGLVSSPQGVTLSLSMNYLISYSVSTNDATTQGLIDINNPRGGMS